MPDKFKPIVVIIGLLMVVVGAVAIVLPMIVDNCATHTELMFLENRRDHPQGAWGATYFPDSARYPDGWEFSMNRINVGKLMYTDSSGERCVVFEGRYTQDEGFILYTPDGDMHSPTDVRNRVWHFTFTLDGQMYEVSWSYLGGNYGWNFHIRSS